MHMNYMRFYRKGSRIQWKNWVILSISKSQNFGEEHQFLQVIWIDYIINNLKTTYKIFITLIIETNLVTILTKQACIHNKRNIWDRAERHDFLPRLWLFFSPFLSS